LRQKAPPRELWLLCSHALLGIIRVLFAELFLRRLNGRDQNHRESQRLDSR
jgi:hypothetical protein